MISDIKAETAAVHALAAIDIDIENELRFVEFARNLQKPDPIEIARSEALVAGLRRARRRIVAALRSAGIHAAHYEEAFK